MFDRTGATVFAVTANDNVLTGAALVQASATSPFTVMSRVGIGHRQFWRRMRHLEPEKSFFFLLSKVLGSCLQTLHVEQPRAASH
jgi:hypothetical protein